MKYKQLHYALKMVLLDVENKYELWKENLREEGILFQVNYSVFSPSTMR